MVGHVHVCIGVFVYHLFTVNIVSVTVMLHYLYQQKTLSHMVDKDLLNFSSHGIFKRKNNQWDKVQNRIYLYMLHI